MTDTSTEAGMQKRREELAESYRQSGNKVGMVRIIGGSVEDFGDYTPADHGEAPKGAEWN